MLILRFQFEDKWRVLLTSKRKVRRRRPKICLLYALLSKQRLIPAEICDCDRTVHGFLILKSSNVDSASIGSASSRYKLQRMPRPKKFLVGSKATPIACLCHAACSVCDTPLPEAEGVKKRRRDFTPMRIRLERKPIKTDTP